MSAMLNLLGLLTLVSMSAVMLNGAGVPVTSLAHGIIGALQGIFPYHLS